ncbi:MAG: HypC/HybG/HupF family hydrogenase formation chaperone [Candidatus Eisenbacteria bacterium]|nr:HypC/HybG/HupF family hydrogenase formation chaperone [Candidatus Eisenbacteria bacterium]
MCLAIPMRLVSVEGERGIVELSGVRREVHLGFVPDLSTGDFVLVHAGFVIEKLEPERAEENLALLRELLLCEGEAAPDHAGESTEAEEQPAQQAGPQSAQSPQSPQSPRTPQTPQSPHGSKNDRQNPQNKENLERQEGPKEQTKRERPGGRLPGGRT